MKKKLRIRLLSALMVLLLLFPLSACAGETYGIEVGALRNEYWDALEDVEGTRLTYWLSCYDCYEGENDDVVARYGNKMALEVKTFDAVEPRSKADLEKHLRKGMDFFEMVKLAGVPQIQLYGTKTLHFPTDGEEILRTHWEEIALADGSIEYTLQEFEFYLPTEKIPYPNTSNPRLYLYEGMPTDDLYKETMDNFGVPVWMDGSYHCFELDYHKLIVFQRGGARNGPGTGYISKIYTYNSHITSVDDLKANLQLGMTFPEVIDVVGRFPFGAKSYGSGVDFNRMLFELGNNTWLEIEFARSKLNAYRFLTPNGETVGEFCY